MGEYNDTVRELRHLKENLFDLSQMYVEAACAGIDMLQKVEETQKNEAKEMLKESYQKYVFELEKMNVTAKGDVCYGGDIYKAKDSIANIIKLHLEIINNLLTHEFSNNAFISRKQLEYVTFLNEFVRFRCSHYRH